MKKILLTALALILGLAATPTMNAQSDLLISGLYDGPLSGGTPKGIELHVLNDIADLSIYGIGSANNGQGSDGQEFTFPAVTATAGDYIYLTSSAVRFMEFFGIAADYQTIVANINGDDAVELFMDGKVVDIIGDIDTDGTGEPWEYLDGWASRVDETDPDGSTFVIANWTFSGIGQLTGGFTNDATTKPFPIGTYDSGIIRVSEIPTIGQWGLIIFGLLMTNLGLVFIYNERKAIA